MQCRVAAQSLMASAQLETRHDAYSTSSDRISAVCVCEMCECVAGSDMEHDSVTYRTDADVFVEDIDGVIECMNGEFR